MIPFLDLNRFFSKQQRSHRRLWLKNGRAHIEIKGMESKDFESLCRKIERDLNNLSGVNWAEVNPLVGRVIVDFSISKIDLDAIVEIVEQAESQLGYSKEGFDLKRPEYPGDLEPIIREISAIVADVGGIGFSLFGRVLQSSPIPIELASIVSLIDSEPRLRNALEARFGVPMVDWSIAFSNAIAQGLAQGPLGLVVDIASRGSRLLEFSKRRSNWILKEPVFFPGPGTQPLDAIASPKRPIPIPGGPIELYADRSSITAVVGAVATGMFSGSFRRGTAIGLAAIPKGARLGREVFSSQLGLKLASQGVVVMNPRTLRVFDRLDCIVIDPDVIKEQKFSIDKVELLVPNADANEIHLRLRQIFNPDDPYTKVEQDEWELEPLLNSDSFDVKTILNKKTISGISLKLSYKGVIQAEIFLQSDSEIQFKSLISLAHRHGFMVALGGGDLSLGNSLGADLVLDADESLTESISMLQRDGCCVSLLGSSKAFEALKISDCGIELKVGETPFSWAGDLVVPGGFSQVAFIIQAMKAAHEVSRQSVALSIAGSSIGSVMALSSDEKVAGSRVLWAINIAALISMANGLRAALSLQELGNIAIIEADAPPWHELAVEEVLALLESSPEGIDSAQASKRRFLLEVPLETKPILWKSILEELSSPFTPLLAGGAVASAAIGSPADAVIVASVVLLSGLIGGVQRYRAEKAVHQLTLSTAVEVKVLRLGEIVEIASQDIVVGDVVFVEAGDFIPADCRIVNTDGLEVDESAMTGESLPVYKNNEASFGSSLGDRSCMLFEGTSIAAGEATAVVVAVGGETELGKAQLLSQPMVSSQGVDARLVKLSSLTFPLVLIGGAIVSLLGALRGGSVKESVSTGVSLSVAAVPEGLPVLTTMAQLASAKRLSIHGALVRNPRAIEALGRVNVLCIDKTGTLTEGNIALHGVSDGLQDVKIDQDWDKKYQNILAGGLRASPMARPEQPLPHLTDRAVLEGAFCLGIETDTSIKGWVRKDELVFEPGRGYHATLGQDDKDTKWLSVKGAPEIILPLCNKWRQGDKDIFLDQSTRGALEKEVDRLARRGFRLLAVGEAPVSSDNSLDEDMVKDLTLLGYLILSDPVRKTASLSVEKLQQAGIRVVMVTGDHPSTAEGIAAEIGILSDGSVLTGSDIAKLDDDELDKIIASVSVFARVTPAEKVRIVASLQRTKQAVAMTGDGANDAPAIRMADVGVAIGTSSTPAARNAADLVLTNERIETLVDAIVEGRSMWVSVRDALSILLGGNLGEVGFTVGAGAISGRPPLSSRQLLLVNLLTDVVPALAIAVRPPLNLTSEQLLAEGPESSLGASLEKAVVLRAVSTAFGAYLAWFLARISGTRIRSNTVALVALVGTQLGQTLITGGTTPSGPVLLASFGSAAVMLLAVQTPIVSQFFGCRPLGPVGLAIAGGSAMTATFASWGASKMLNA